MIKSKLIFVLLMGIAFLFFAKPLSTADDYRISYVAEFSLNDLSFGSLTDYDIVTLKDGEWSGDPGKPMLPFKELKIALPGGMAVERVYVTDAISEDISGEYNIFPAQPPQKIGLSGEDFVEPNQEIYASAEPYPKELVEFVNQGDLAGQGIAQVLIYPLQYIPAEKRLKFYSSLTLSIEGSAGYKYGDRLSPNISEKGRETYEQMIKDMVVNPEQVELSAPMEMSTSTLLPDGPFNHVIVTNSSYASDFQPLVDWHIKKGVKDTVVTTAWIYSNYTGSTNQEKIRNFVIDAYFNWGTTYFLMGGENGDVPFEYRTYYEDYTPSDQYYSDFDDDWIHEVFVGRVTGQSSTEINTFVNKVLKYEKDPPRTDYPLNVLLIGMDLDTATPTEDLKENIDNYIPSHFNVTKVYDSDATNHKTDALNALNAGQNLVNHSDHSSSGYMGTGDRNHSLGIYVSNVDALTNDNKMSIVVSLGCSPNQLDYNDCIAEYFVIRNPNQAGVAFTGNTRHGWYSAGTPISLSGVLDREWWRGLFTRYKYRLGETLVDAKHNSSNSTDITKQCEWTFNLLGEPEMPIWTDSPDSFAVTFPAVLPTGNSSFSVHVEDSTTHSPVYMALVCLWKGNEVYMKGTTDIYGDKIFDPSPSSTGTMYVTITKKNYIPYEGEAQVASPVVITQPATNVEETTARINGYLEDDDGFVTACWLFWDTDSGEPYAYSESLGVMQSDSQFYVDLTSLTQGELYYFNAKAHSDVGWVSGGELIFLTKPLPPTGLTADTTSYSTINLTWSMPESADSVIIERNGSVDWSLGEGTEIYYGSGTEYEDSGLEPSHHYYYQAWSYCSEGGLDQYSDESAAADATTPYRPGDANADKEVTIADAVYIVNYLFKSGPAPNPLDAGDANCDEEVGISDVVYLINYLFRSGPAPCE
jgi:hypothetical protein